MNVVPNPLLKVETVGTSWLGGRHLSVARADTLHPVVSGNKWYKLKYYLEDARNKGFLKIATFGGCYSNHIVATAFAAKEAGLSSLGIIRGEETSAALSPTLQAAASYGMQLRFVSRSAYRDKASLSASLCGYYPINEGGYGRLGARGAEEILTAVKEYEKYTHVVLAVGTGTTLAGISNAAKRYQKIIGVSVMKNNFSLTDEVSRLFLPKDVPCNFVILHDYHFGGYAKKTTELITFMNSFYAETGIPTDFVYTAKALYALQILCLQQAIASEARILFIHTGGLQGNQSLPANTLVF